MIGVDRLPARGRAAGVAAGTADVWDTRWWSPVGAALAEGLRALA